MGACYSVELKIKVKDEQSAFNALKNFIARGEEMSINYNLDLHEQEGLSADCLENCIRIFLAQWKGHNTPLKKELGDGFTMYISDFNARYSWGSVIVMMFEEPTPYLEDDSQLYINPDNDYDLFKIIDGKCVQIH